MTPLKPWGQHCVESHGDYTEETWLEDHIGGPLYQHQKQLPRLPVPPIPQSLERLVPTALPLAKSDIEAQNLLEAVKKFPEQAVELQNRLEAHAAANSNTSWLQKWWNQAGYLQVRDTIVVNVSYFFHFADDPTALSPTQRAAALLTACGEFRKLVCSGQLPAETIGRGDKAKTLCSTAYKYMFHACRIPLEHQDSYKIFDPSLYHHAIVACNGHFFSIDLIDPETAEPYHVETLESAISNCLKQAELMGDGPFLGWFTSWNRDDWAKTRKLLLETGGEEMRNALEKLESGAVLLAMDDERVVSRAECGEWLLHGGLSNGKNRWFDKSIQIIVGSNGKAGLQGEHSMMDGMPMVSLADRMTKTSYAQCLTRTAAPKGFTVVAPIFSSQLLEKIRDTIEPCLKKGMNKAGKKIWTLVILLMLVLSNNSKTRF
jgi:carnitine O-acetyltransferase